ncbi:hypothetical protein FRC07_004953 [Ceratobasidium sp. 392]|nr:hypothetical protein FRC07_004953 [Ceratobasidium sp. 392]
MAPKVWTGAPIKATQGGREKASWRGRSRRKKSRKIRHNNTRERARCTTLLFCSSRPPRGAGSFRPSALCRLTCVCRWWWPGLAVLLDTGVADEGVASTSRFVELLPDSLARCSSTTVVSSAETASGSSTAARSRAILPSKPVRSPSLPVAPTQTPTPPASPPSSTRPHGLAFNRQSLAVIDERTSPQPPPKADAPPPPLSTYAKILARFRRGTSLEHVVVPAAASAGTGQQQARAEPVAGPSTGPAVVKHRKTLKKRGSQPIRPEPTTTASTVSTTKTRPPTPVTRTASPAPARPKSPPVAARPKSPPPAPAPIPVPTPAPTPLPPRRGRSRTGAVPPPPEMHRPSSPQPTKQNLKSWWKQFKLAQGVSFKRDQDDLKTGPHAVFGIPLRESLRYASVQISTADPSGELYVWGYIPVVVAKCGLFLKENGMHCRFPVVPNLIPSPATEVEGVFRINGSNRRMRDLQTLFESPPRYGKDLNWKNESYTSHDVASVFRRYLTQMPEPVIPNEQYHSFRAALSKQPRDVSEVIHTYRRLIKEMPRANQYLLLYVLDLLSVFARKADKNLMTESNLAVIFRPGIISHPAHEMQPQEHALSQQVLVFLIQHQDHFMLDPPTRGDSIMVSAGTNVGLSPASERTGYMVPSDSDEVRRVLALDEGWARFVEPPEGGWRLVERKNVNPAANLGRRRSLNSPAPTPTPVVLTAEPESMAPNAAAVAAGDLPGELQTYVPIILAVRGTRTDNLLFWEQSHTHERVAHVDVLLPYVGYHVYGADASAYRTKER